MIACAEIDRSIISADCSQSNLSNGVSNTDIHIFGPKVHTLEDTPL